MAGSEQAHWPGPVGGAGADPELALLVSRIARGDQRAYEQFYDRAAGPVLGLVLSVLRDLAQSEEVMQEVLLEAWRTASRYDPARGSAMSWLMMLAHRRAVDRVRSEQRAADREQRATSAQVDYDDVIEAVESALDRERVRRCLDVLTDLQRESVTLAYYGGYS